MQRARNRLVELLAEKGITSELVLAAIRIMPWYLLVESWLLCKAYEDSTLLIGQGQSISHSYIVALITQALLASFKV